MNRTSLRTLLTSLLLTATGTAQLSGTYTIDSSLPTGGSNYTSFSDAANDLATLGVANAAPGDVTFQVAAGAGPYAAFALDVIPGTSAVNRVIFLGAPSGGPRPVVSGASGGLAHTVRLGIWNSLGASAAWRGPSYVVLDNLEITGATYEALLVTGGYNIVIRNCVVHTSGSGIGLLVTHHSVIEDCEVYGTSHNPTGSIPNYSGAIFLYYLSANNVIQRNRIHDCADNGIFMGGSSSAKQTPDNTVINNFIWNCVTQVSAWYAGGIACRNATNCIIANNSVSMPANSIRAGIFIMGGSQTAPLLPQELSNNIVQHAGTSACIQTEYTGQLPAVCDYNLYDTQGGGPVGVTATSISTVPVLHMNLSAWQAAHGADASSIQGPASFVQPTDLHVAQSSIAVDAGIPVAAVLGDIDGQPRPLGGAPDIGADEVPGSGLFAGLSASPTYGQVPLTVSFTDASYSSSPGGVTSWAWDFDNNGTVDSGLQNPTHVYSCPGTYSVSLMVSDGANPSATQTLSNYIQVGDFAFDLQSSGGGIGDLTIHPVPTTCGAAMGATSGWTLVSLATYLPVGAGPAFGLIPDPSTLTFLFWPQAPGSLPHFTVTPGMYPDAGPVVLPPGSVSGLAGVSLDAVMLFVGGPTSTLVYVSNVDRVTL